MQTIVEGKHDVLAFLENESLKRTNEQPGIYRLWRDDAGRLILSVEGFTFVGLGEITLGKTILKVQDGVVQEIQKPS